MAQAYDFALDKIGMEIMSYQVEFIVLNIWKYSSEVCMRRGYVLKCENNQKYINILFYFLDLGGLHQFLKRRVSIVFIFNM